MKLHALFGLLTLAGSLLAPLAFAQDPTTTPPAARSSNVSLDEMAVSVFSTGWGKPTANQSVANQALSIGGEKFRRGLGVHAPSVGSVKLDGKATRFQAKVGVNDGGHNEAGSVVFTILGDGKELYSTAVIRGGDKAVPIDVPITGVRQLRLMVTDGGDGNNSDHGTWADATISYFGAKPVAMAASTPFDPYEPAEFYPTSAQLTASKGGTAYFVDPAKGDDFNTGRTAGKPWKSLAKINALALASGDKVTIAPGVHEVTLKPSANGTADKPVVIEFLPGTHEFAVEHALRRPWYVSNSCDAPHVPKPVAILVENSQHVQLQGGGVEGSGKTLILMGGRMIEVINSNAENITFSKLVFDLKRPTVSEFRVMETGTNNVVIQVAEQSTYEIKNGKFAWTGDLGSGWIMAQRAIPETGQCSRLPRWSPFGSAVAEDLGGSRVRLTFPSGTSGMQTGHQFQFRHVNRDSVGVHNTRSKDIVFRDCNFYALTNMGIVSQFTENITYQRVNVESPKGTFRTCPAWGDIFQFSNCKGEILVDSCRQVGMQDDALNCHGTHLRIIDKPSENQLHLRFMHPQTYGFAAYAPGDEVAVINHSTLREYAGNPRRKVTAAIPLAGDKTGKEWLITLDGPAPAFEKDDVIDNITWYPNLTVRNGFISLDPVRGFLITTRGKALVEGNTFHRCAMPGILVEDDANGWFESGPIRDLTVRNNRFIGCGIKIEPQTRTPELPVHENVRILDNEFDGGGISVAGTRGLTLRGNRFAGKEAIALKHCSEVTR